MGTINKILNKQGYTLREKFNFYAGMALPPIIATSAIYFGALQGNPINDPWYETLGKGVLALAFNIPLAPVEFVAGAVLAGGSIAYLRMNRSKKKEKTLEQEVQA
jgi:hypothetical protein